MIALISAIGEKNEIGLNNKLLWIQKSDMKRFKELTTNNIVIMGLNTFKSLNYKPLKDRINIVLSDQPIEQNGILVYNNFNELLKFCNYHKDKQIFIIGGQTIYNLFIRYADTLYITRIHNTFEADTYFPVIDNNIWESNYIEHYKKDENNENDYSFITYIRK